MRLVNRSRGAVGIDPLVVHPRRPHRPGARPAGHRPLLRLAVPHHQPELVRIARVRKPLDVLRHPPCPFASQHVQRRRHDPRPVVPAAADPLASRHRRGRVGDRGVVFLLSGTVSIVSMGGVSFPRPCLPGCLALFTRKDTPPASRRDPQLSVILRTVRSSACRRSAGSCCGSSIRGTCPGSMSRSWWFRPSPPHFIMRFCTGSTRCWTPAPCRSSM